MIRKLLFLTVLPFGALAAQQPSRQAGGQPGVTVKAEKPALADGINGGWLISVVAALISFVPVLVALLARLFLHAWRLELAAPGDGHLIRATAPLPDELEGVLPLLKVMSK